MIYISSVDAAVMTSRQIVDSIIHAHTTEHSIQGYDICVVWSVGYLFGGDVGYVGELVGCMGGPFKLHARASKGMNFQRGSSPQRPKR